MNGYFLLIIGIIRTKQYRNTALEGVSVERPEYRQKWTDRYCWARGYYVSTVGNVNEETIIQYIRELEENDKLEDGRK